jgi:hypothetical protein
MLSFVYGFVATAQQRIEEEEMTLRRPFSIQLTPAVQG